MKNVFTVAIKKVKKFKCQILASLSVITYVFIVLYLMDIKLPASLYVICLPICMISFALILLMCITEYISKLNFKTPEKFTKALRNRVNILRTELDKFLTFYIIVLLARLLLYSITNVNTPKNQQEINEALSYPNFGLIFYIVIFGPIIEEIIFHFLPANFINSKMPYIIISALIFAGAHVVADSNPFITIWLYLPNFLYYGYRYYETKDLLVPISFHIFNNLLSVLPTIIRWSCT